MKQCVNCGREIDDSLNTCPYCGTIQKRDPKYVALVLGVGGLAIIILVLFLLFSLKNLFTRQIDNSVETYNNMQREMKNAENTASTENASEEYVTYNSVRDVYSQDKSQLQNAVSQYNVYSQVISKANLNSQEAKAQNSLFEPYFGKDVNPTEVKNLMSEIRTNNLTASRVGENAVVGVCYISPDATADEMNGIYGMSIDSKNISDTTFDNYTFTPDVQNITSQLKAGKTYTVNVANTKAWNKDQEGLTGFETAETVDNTIGKSVTGSTGGYYSSGYIRLIYIVENQ